MKGRAALLLLSLTACIETVGKAWLIDRPRVIAARVEAASDPGRASIAAGEEARVTWLAVGAPRFSYAFAVCKRPEGNYPDPRCETTLASGGGEGGQELVTSFTVPESDLLVLAAFCDVGAVRLDAPSFTGACEGGGEALLASVEVRSEPNRNPEIAPDAIRIDPACSRAERNIGFRFDPQERGETLILSHVVTAGELDRQYSVVEADEPTPKEVTIPWKPPAEPGNVEIFFVLRDGRGGTAFVRRTICVGD